MVHKSEVASCSCRIEYATRISFCCPLEVLQRRKRQLHEIVSARTLFMWRTSLIVCFFLLSGCTDAIVAEIVVAEIITMDSE